MNEVRRLSRRFEMQAAFVLLLVAVAYRALWSLDISVSGGAMTGAEEWFFSPTGESSRLILGLGAVLLLGRWQRLLQAIEVGRSSLVGAALLAAAAAIHLWSLRTEAHDLLIPSLALLLLASGWFLGGPGAARVLLKPALFLFLAMPIPAVLLNAVLFPLQLATATSTAALVQLLGMEVSHHGELLFIRGRVFQVIEECTGLRGMATLVMSALVYTELFRRSRLYEAILILASPAIGLLVNQFRVLALVLNPYAEIDGFHGLQGVIAIVVGVLLLAVLDALLQKALPARAGRAAPSRPESAATTPPTWRMAVLAGVALALGAATFALPPWERARADQASIHVLPGRLAGWKFQSIPYDARFMGNVAFSERLTRRYGRGDEVVDLMVGVDDHLDRRSLRSEKTKLLGAGRTVRWERTVSLPPDELLAKLVRVDGVREGELAYHWYADAAPLWSEAVRAAWALDRRPGATVTRAMVVRVSTPVRDGPGEEKAAQLRLQGFLRALRPVLDALALPAHQALERLVHREAVGSERR